jgi:hypothetical protein
MGIIGERDQKHHRDKISNLIRRKNPTGLSIGEGPFFLEDGKKSRII